MKQVDVIIIGAGAAGLLCAIEAGKRRRRVIVLDHANMPGKKILMSGGGRCNFTNLHTSPGNFISHNPHFCKSALSRYTQWDFIDLVNKHHIPYHEKTLGQLFCDHKSKAILAMLLQECENANVTIQLNTSIQRIENRAANQYYIRTEQGEFICESLVIATGGLSIPTLGASAFGYKIAEQFGLSVHPTRAGLVPLTLQDDDKMRFSVLSGISVRSRVKCQQQSFDENLLFTHRGLSGPAILQISSYWSPGDAIHIEMLADLSLHDLLKCAKQAGSQKQLKTLLSEYFPVRLVEVMVCEDWLLQKLPALSQENLNHVAESFQSFYIKPNGTEGYRTAEVTLGGVDCCALSSKTMEVKSIPGLYFIGEVVDVTGWLGGYNFQWAWSSGWAAGQVA